MVSFISIGNRWKIILYCTGFNLLFEYSIRSINNIPLQPLLPFALIGVYFIYFTMFEDLILRYKMRDYQAMLVAFFLGTFYMAFASGYLFYHPLILGINYLALLFVNIVWWGGFQTVLTFYLVNRISPRDWNHSRLGKIGWTLCLFISGLLLVLFQLNPLPRGTPEGFISMIIIVVVFGYFSYRSLKNNYEKEPINFEPSKIIDFLMVSSILLCTFCAIFLIYDPTMSGASRINFLALRIIIIWTLVVGTILFIYRLISKKPIPI